MKIVLFIVATICDLYYVLHSKISTNCEIIYKKRSSFYAKKLQKL